MCLKAYGEAHNIIFAARTAVIEEKESTVFVEDADSASFNFKGTLDKPMTMSQILEMGGVDTKIWEPVRVVIKSWGVTAKIKEYAWVDGANGKKRTVPTGQKLQAGKNYGIAVTLEKRREKPEVLIAAALDRLIPKLRKATAKYKPKATLKMAAADDKLLEIAIFDIHVGKLAWGEETEGADWDTKIAASNFLSATNHMLAFYPQVDRILFPVGNDFFHVDTVENTTTAGTRQDVDTRWAKAFDIGCSVVINAVKMCLEVAPVEIVVVPGNHDMSRAYSMGRVVKEAFNHISHVKVDNSPPQFKRFVWGTNLLGFTHGDRTKPDRLPAEMAVRWPKEWAATTHREWHIGHTHGMRNKVMIVEGHEDQEVRVRTIPSLCPQDAWHSKALYRNIRTAEGYLWSRRDGYVSHTSCPAKLLKP